VNRWTHGASNPGWLIGALLAAGAGVSGYQWAVGKSKVLRSTADAGTPGVSNDHPRVAWQADHSRSPRI
jgi:hypothetical protein